MSFNPSINMKKYLIDYFSERSEKMHGQEGHHVGPVVTISREFGCGANDLTAKLMKVLISRNKEWKHVNKEILEETARELHTQPDKIKHVFNPHDKNVLSDMLTGLSHAHAVSDARVHKVVSEVIASFAHKGKVIIVGRGGVAITRTIPNSLHIKLMAPIEWRAQGISERRKITMDKARELALDFDHRRDLFINHLLDKKEDNSIYDLILNRMSLSDEELIGIILYAMEKKNLI